MQIRSHKDLRVWQMSKALVVEIYRLSQGLPPHELYGLSSQLRRAAISIPANIAEGHGRNTRKDYANFIGVAYGSLMELETLLEIAIELGYFTFEKSSNATTMVGEVGKMLLVLRSKLQIPAT